RYMYKGDGAPIGNRFNAITAPLTYPNWYDNRILTSERPPDPYYGLQEHLTHLGYGAFAFIPTNSDRSLNHYVKGATPLI
ncbi:MAG: hypothetical protein ACEQSA_03965, partial [Weeksellaceae bacterium]